MNINLILLSIMKRIDFIKGDATLPKIDLPGVHVIAHCCNDVGQFGAGFVVPLAKQYPGVKQDYKSYIKNTENPLGTVFMFKTKNENLWIANIIGQHGLVPINGEPPVRYSALKEGFLQTVKFFKTEQIHFHMPRLGCGLAGGEWSNVETILNEILLFNNVETMTVYDLVK